MFASDQNLDYYERLRRAKRRVEDARHKLHEAEWALEIVQKEQSIRRLMEKDTYGRQI